EGLMHVREAGIAGVTGAEADDKPAVRELIDRRRLARDVPRPSPWQRDDLDPEPDLTGPNRHSRDRDPRVARRHRRVPLAPDVVLEKDPVPAGCLRELRELDEETRVTALTARRQSKTVEHRPKLPLRHASPATAFAVIWLRPPESQGLSLTA